MNKESFDAIIWLRADDCNKLAKGFGDIAMILNLETVSTDLVVSKELVLDSLSRSAPVHNNSEHFEPPRWLLIFDNADDPSLIVDYIPVTGGGSILITSHDPQAKDQTYFRTTTGVDLDELPT